MEASSARILRSVLSKKVTFGSPGWKIATFKCESSTAKHTFRRPRLKIATCKYESIVRSTLSEVGSVREVHFRRSRSTIGLTSKGCCVVASAARRELAQRTYSTKLSPSLRSTLPQSACAAQLAQSSRTRKATLAQSNFRRALSQSNLHRATCDAEHLGRAFAQSNLRGATRASKLA